MTRGQRESNPQIGRDPRIMMSNAELFNQISDMGNATRSTATPSKGWNSKDTIYLEDVEAWTTAIPLYKKYIGLDKAQGMDPIVPAEISVLAQTDADLIQFRVIVPAGNLSSVLKS